MAVRKPRTPPTVADRVVADRVARSRRKDPRWDPMGQYFDQCVELAREVGADVTDVYEEFGERSACRVYLGELSIAEAERLAMDDTRERFEKQGELI